nr:hypothetical protein [Tanacetum cinerariifolium]
MFLVYGGVVVWKSTKQSIFATSSAKTEYIAASDAFKEAVWVRKFIHRLGVVPIIEEPIKIYCDNIGSITIANESRITKGARHYRAKIHYLCESQIVETLRVMSDMRREMGDMQAELLALRGQPKRAGQPGGEVRVLNHQDAPWDADSNI